MIRGLVFDIDDTLYDEIDYVRSGFAHVAREAEGPEVTAATLERWLMTSFEAGVRGDAFDRLLEAYPSIATRTSKAHMIDVYRLHEPDIRLDPGVDGLLSDLHARGISLAILSDGAPEGQRAKVRALGLERWFAPIVLTGSLGAAHAKPATAGFDAIGRDWGLGPSELAYVADNPAKDFAGPRRLGWTTIRLRHARQLRSTLETCGFDVPARPRDRCIDRAPGAAQPAWQRHLGLAAVGISPRAGGHKSFIGRHWTPRDRTSPPNPGGTEDPRLFALIW